MKKPNNPFYATKGEVDAFEKLIDSCGLNETQATYLRHCWLRQMTGMERRGDQFFFVDRLLQLLIGGSALSVTFLLALKPIFNDKDAYHILEILPITTSLFVGLFSLIPKVMNYGDRWRFYRYTAEQLKLLGWKFFNDLQLEGVDKQKLYKDFTEQIDAIIERRAGTYLMLMQDRLQETDSKTILTGASQPHEASRK